MFSLFKNKSQSQRLEEKYKKLMEEAHRLSTVNRAQSDQKVAEAHLVLNELNHK